MDGDMDDTGTFERKKLLLDANGVPTGTLASVFVKDLHAFSKELNPTATPGWLGQSREAKKRLWQRIRGSWEFGGATNELDEGYFRKKMSVCVSRSKFQLNERIRQGLSKPPEVKQIYWDKLVELQNDPDVIEKSGHMANISQGRPPKDEVNMKLHNEAVSNLVVKSIFLCCFGPYYARFIE